MPLIPFATAAAAGNYQLTGVPPAYRSVRITEALLAADGDVNTNTSLAALVDPASPGLQAALPFRVNLGAISWQGDASLPPGCPLVLQLGGSTITKGGLNVSIDGPPYLAPTNAAVWTPAAVSDIGSWLSPAGTQWSDNRSTQATVTGDRVYRWASNVLSLDGLAADITTNRLYRTLEGGVRGDTIAATYKLFSVATCGDFTILAKVRRTGAAGGGYFGPVWSASARMMHDGSGNLQYFDDTVTGGGAVNLGTMTVNQWYTAGLKRQNGVLYIRGSMGTQWVRYGCSSNPALSGVVASPSGGPLSINTELLEAAFVFRAITDAEWAQFNTCWGT